MYDKKKNRMSAKALGPNFRLTRFAKMVLTGYSGKHPTTIKRQLITAETARMDLKEDTWR